MNEILFWIIFIVAIVVVTSLLVDYQESLDNRCKKICGDLESKWNQTCFCKYQNEWYNTNITR